VVVIRGAADQDVIAAPALQVAAARAGNEQVAAGAAVQVVVAAGAADLDGRPTASLNVGPGAVAGEQERRQGKENAGKENGGKKTGQRKENGTA
jgi:hypothetical protein